MVMVGRVQIDYMTVTKNGICVNHFQAWDQRSKFMDADIYSHAKSPPAKRFLLALVKKAPFKIESIAEFAYLLLFYLQKSQPTMGKLSEATVLLGKSFTTKITC